MTSTHGHSDIEEKGENGEKHDLDIDQRQQ